MARTKKRKAEQGFASSLGPEAQPAHQRAKQQHSSGQQQRAGSNAAAMGAAAAAAAAGAHRLDRAPQPQQNGKSQTVRVEMVILPSPVRGLMRGKRSAAASPAAAPAPGARRPQLGVAAAAAALERAAAPPRQAVQPVPPIRPAAAAAARPAAAAAAAAAGARPQAAAPAAPRPPAPVPPGPQAAAAVAAGPAAGQAAVPAAGPEAGQAPAAGSQASVTSPRQRQRSSSGNGGGGGGGKKRKKRKTLTAKGKKAAVLGVLAEVELNRAAEAAGAAAAAVVAAGAAGAAAAAAAAPPGEQQQPPVPQQAQQQQQQQAQQVQQPPAPQQAQQAQQLDPAATANLGKAWQKADISKLARLAEDRAFLLQAIPEHPAEGELDWELIARHFGRYSRGGAAVRQQYYSVVRLMKEARHEGKRGTSYVDLVQRALSSLPDRRGTVYEIQAVLKRDCASCLDKYQTPKGVRWKLAVSEVLRDQQALFEASGKTASGKIVWRLRDAPAAG